MRLGNMGDKLSKKGRIKENWRLFIAFFRVGMLGYGGGPASIPLVHKEVVDKYGWMDNEDFGDLLALANALPGPIGTKLPGYIGYKVTGTLGLIISVLASIIPTIVLVIFLLNTLTSFKDFDWVKGMTAAVLPVVGVMLGSLTLQFFNKSMKGMGIWKTIMMSICIFVPLYFFHVHPGIIIVILLIIALVQKEGAGKRQEQSREKGDAS